MVLILAMSLANTGTVKRTGTMKAIHTESKYSLLSYKANLCYFGFRISLLVYFGFSHIGHHILPQFL